MSMDLPEENNNYGQYTRLWEPSDDWTDNFFISTMYSQLRTQSIKVIYCTIKAYQTQMCSVYCTHTAPRIRHYFISLSL